MLRKRRDWEGRRNRRLVIEILKNWAKRVKEKEPVEKEPKAHQENVTQLERAIRTSGRQCDIR